MAKPTGAAGIAVVPAHRDLVRGTPARVVVVRASGALGVRRLGRRRRGARLRAVAVVTGGLRLHRGGHGRGDLLVQRPGLGLALLLSLLAAALGLLLAGGEVGSQPCRISWSQGRLMVARRWSFRSSTSRIVLT